MTNSLRLPNIKLRAYNLLIKSLGLSKSNIDFDKKGLVILLVDAVSHNVVQKAIEKGYAPFLKKILEGKEYSLFPYFCGLPAKSSTCQAELFYGSSKNITSFAWYEKNLQRFIRCDVGENVKLFEKIISRNKKGFLSGGANVMGVFSGGAMKSSFSLGDFTSRKNLSKIYKLRLLILPLLNPIQVARFIYLFMRSVLQALGLRIGRNIRRESAEVVSQNLSRIFFADLPFFVSKIEILRETPIIFVNFELYATISDFFGEDSKESLQTIKIIDNYFRKLYETTLQSKRAYDFVALSDHGQSNCIVFNEHFSQKLAGVLSEALDDKKRNVVKTNGNIEMKDISMGKDIILISEGSFANVYFTERLGNPYTKSEIESQYKNLTKKLISHPGIGWILVRLEGDRKLFVGKSGYIIFKNQRVVKTVGIPFPHLKIKDKIIRSLAKFSQSENIGDLVIFGNVKDKKVYSFSPILACHGGFYGNMLNPFIVTKNPKIIESIKMDDSMKNIFKLIRNQYRV